MRLAIALLALGAASSARAWTVDDVAVEPGVPAELAAGWQNAGKGAPGWDKYYFESELGEERTVWCRRDDCDSALRSGDYARRVPLYYLAPLDGARMRAILSAYTIHWEPSRDGGLVEAVSRDGTSLALRPSRPWKKGDAWSLQGGVAVLPPESREAVSPRAAILADAGYWPACANLEASSYGGAVKRLHPIEIEIQEAAAPAGTPWDPRVYLGSLSAREGGAETAARSLRGSAYAAAEKELKGREPSDRFNAFEARFLLCRVKRYDHFSIFRSELSRTAAPEAFVAKWRRFVRGEMAVYLKEESLPLGYQNELDAAGRRTLAVLDGSAPAVALGPENRAHLERMQEASERVQKILEQEVK